jgi:hypothetical protein
MTDRQERIEAGIALRDEALARVAKRAEGEERGWTERALDFLHNYAKTHATFTAEDVALAAKGAGIEAAEGRVWGSVMRRAMLRGWVTHTHRYVPSTNPTCHRSPKAVWESNCGG